jgi:hypothetical protein
MQKTYIDANGNEIVYVRKKAYHDNGVDYPAGPSSPCLASHHGYAIASGYEDCAPPGAEFATVETVEPEEVDSSDVATLTATEDSRTEVIGPETADVSPAIETAQKSKPNSRARGK